MPVLKQKTRIALISTAVIAVLLYASIVMLQRSDAATIDTAKEVDAFVHRHCDNTGRTPSMKAVLARFPYFSRGVEWVFFTDSRTYFKMQYPVKWWNSNAIGVRKLSDFSHTPNAYVVEYRCGKPQ